MKVDLQTVKAYLIGGACLVAFLLLCSYLFDWFDWGGGQMPVRSNRVALKAAISFNGTEFTIHNKDSFDWSNVNLDLNWGELSHGYMLRVPTIPAGSSLKVSATQFANSNGMRFNPFTMKPLRVGIKCDTPSGVGSAAVGW